MPRESSCHRFGGWRRVLRRRVGPGIGDDKGIYPFVPDMIKYYLGEAPILSNVETFRPVVPAHKQHILANLGKLVVKAVDASGGYGMLIGPASTSAQRDEFRAKIEATMNASLAFVSLFPPRNTLESLAEARRVISADQK